MRDGMVDFRVRDYFSRCNSSSNEQKPQMHVSHKTTSNTGSFTATENLSLIVQDHHFWLCHFFSIFPSTY